MAEDRYRSRSRSRSSGWLWLLAVLIAIAALFGWRWWSQHEAEMQEAATATAPEQPGPEDAAPVAPMAAASGPAHPLETDAAAPLPALSASDGPVGTELAGLLGRPAVQSFLRTDGFVRRAVATIDNLDRPLAPASLWPVQPAPQRFTVDGAGATATLAAVNAKRYAGFVALVQSVDAARTAALYRRFYPLFQQAYVELGYPKRYFNDRVVAVIDHLLQAPEPTGPVRLRLVEVKGEVPSTRPWTRYEFADPELEALSAGQKIMVRVGLENERRLKAKLAQFRQQVAGARP